MFETKHAKRGTALSDGDTFFHKLDALHTLCEAAAQKGLAVYAVAQQANAENATYRDTVLADIRQRYATAGIAVPMAANGAQGPFSIYSTPQGTLAAVTPESVAQAGEFFLLTTSADFGGAVFTQAAVSAAPAAMKMPRNPSAMFSSAMRTALHSRRSCPTALISSARPRAGKAAS